MTVLYPRLAPHEGRALVARFGPMTVDQLRSEAGVPRTTTYTPTGGVPAGPDRLRRLEKDVRTCAEMYGYPQPVDDRCYSDFDRSTAVLLHTTMDLVPAEAAEPDIWTYLAVCQLPDVVRWRFDGEYLPRWLGRGLVRHTFARLWWQAYALSVDVDGTRDYSLIHRLRESDLNQVFERRSIGGVPSLARAVARELVDPRLDKLEVSRRKVVRDATKRIRRLLPFTCVLGLSEEEMSARIRSVFDESIREVSRLEGA
ncbi:DUF6339 family protein [Streptomyces sp. NPDC003674]